MWGQSLPGTGVPEGSFCLGLMQEQRRAAACPATLRCPHLRAWDVARVASGTPCSLPGSGGSQEPGERGEGSA